VFDSYSIPQRVPGFLYLRRNWVPSPARECCSPFWIQGGRHTRVWGMGLGGPNSDEGTEHSGILMYVYYKPSTHHTVLKTELKFLKSPWGLGTKEEEVYRTGPPGYIGWRNSFLGINSGAPYTFKNTGSGWSWSSQKTTHLHSS
jgi:hypothetical protein